MLGKIKRSMMIIKTNATNAPATIPHPCLLGLSDGSKILECTLREEKTTLILQLHRENERSFALGNESCCICFFYVRLGRDKPYLSEVLKTVANIHEFYPYHHLVFRCGNTDLMSMLSILISAVLGTTTSADQPNVHVSRSLGLGCASASRAPKIVRHSTDQFPRLVCSRFVMVSIYLRFATKTPDITKRNNTYDSYIVYVMLLIDGVVANWQLGHYLVIGFGVSTMMLSSFFRFFTP